MMTTDVHNIAQFNAPRLARFLLTVVFLLTPWVGAQALGLGEVSVSSAINEPLNAEIELLNLQGLEEEELIVSIGSSADYSLAGVRYNFFHAELDFEPDFSNTARPVVRVTTDRAVTEPYLNFVVQARWPAGRLLREYTLLLDLPVFSGEQTSSGASAPAVAPARPVQRQTTQTTNAVNVTPSPAASAPPTPAGSYRVQFGDTLWEIAQRVAQESGITHSQAMLALRDLNREAFFDDDMNRIMSGSLLRIPTANDVTVRDPASARAQVARELGMTDSTPLQSTATAPASSSPNSEGGQFRLATAGAETVSSSGSESGQGASSAAMAEVEAENAVLKEELDAVVVENDDLRERLAQLEEQIAVLERLVEVENTDMAQAQALSESAEAQATTPPVVITPPAPQPSFMDKVMGWLPGIGIALIGLLLAAYMLVKRRQQSSAEADLDMSDDDMEADFGEGFDDGDDEDEPLDDTEDEAVVMGEADSFDAEDEKDTAEDDDFDLPDEDDFSTSHDDDDDTDFDDLDAFFGDIDDKSSVDEDDFDDALIQDEQTEEETLESVADSEESLDLGDEQTLEEIEQGLDEDMELGVVDGDDDFEGEDDASLENDDALDFDLGLDDEEGEAEESPAEAEPESEEADENAMDFDLGEDDMEIDGEEAAVEAAGSDEDTDAENGMDFDLGDLDTESEELEEDESESEELEADDENGMDFDLGDTDFDTEETDEDSAEPMSAETDAADENAMDFDLGDSDTETDELADEATEEAAESSDDTMDFDLDDDAESDAEEESFVLGEDSDFADEDEDEDEDAESLDSLLVEDSDSDDDLDDSIFADLGDDDLDDLLGPTDDGDMESLLGEGEDDSDISLDTDDDEEEQSLEIEEESDDEDLSSLTAMLDSGELDDASDEDAEEVDSIDENEIGFDLDEDDEASDFDGADEDEESDIEVECATKLELAEAYLDMGDDSGAKVLLKEVQADGSEEQKAKAQELLDKMS